MIWIIPAGIAAVVMILFIIFFKSEKNKVQYLETPLSTEPSEHLV